MLVKMQKWDNRGNVCVCVLRETVTVQYMLLSDSEDEASFILYLSFVVS